MFASSSVWRTRRARQLPLFLIALFSLLFCVRSSHAGALYSGALVPTGINPDAMAAGDFNADGVSDFAVVNYADHTVSIFLANTLGGVGDGTFTEVSNFEVGEEPWDIAAGDLNGDGASDLAVTEAAAGRVSIWLANTPGGTPDGTFSAGPAPGVWQYPVSVLFKDLNGDGNDDIAAANYWSDNVSVFYGDGAGGFSGNEVLEAGSRPIDLVTGDFNKDGLVDLVAVNFLSDNATLYLGQAGGGFSLFGNLNAGARPVAAASGALVDGIDDLAFANYYLDQISLLETTASAQSQGTLFGFQTQITAKGSPRSLAFANLTPDTNLDLVYALEANDQVGVSVGNNVGTYENQTLYFGGYRPMQVVPMQVDGDGYLDIAVTSHWSHGIIILNGLGTGGAAAGRFSPLRYATGPKPTRTLLADLNGDTYLDLITLDVLSSAVNVRKGQAGPVWFNDNSYTGSTGVTPEAIALGHFTNNQLPAVVAVNSATSFLSVFGPDPASNSLISTPIRIPVQKSPRDVLVADFDRNNVDDIITFSSATGRLDLVRGTLSSTITPQSFKKSISIAIDQSDANGESDARYTSTSPSAEGGRAVALGDANNDGFSDVLVGFPGENTVRLYYGSAVLDTIPDLTFVGPQSGERFGASVAFGDIDDDGFDDIIIGAPSNDTGATDAGMVYLYRGNEDATVDLSVSGTQEGEALGSSLASGMDFSGDGIVDWATGSPGYDGIGPDAGRVYVFYGGGLDNSADLTLEGAAPGDHFGTSVASARDFNADGTADLVVGAPKHSESLTEAGRIYVFPGGSSANLPFLTADGPAAKSDFGASVAGIGDYNGDGIDDVAAGAPLYDSPGGQNLGAVLYFYGGTSAPGAANLQINGTRTNEYFGSSVAPAGHPQEGDEQDMLVGAPGYVSEVTGSPERNEYGRVYLFGAGSTNISGAVVIASGKVPSANFGAAVAGDGDLNKDGYSDWLVGAPNDPSLASGAGRAFAFKGGRGGIPGLGAIASGDFNADGEADLVAINQDTGDINILMNDPNYIFVNTDRPVSTVIPVDGKPIAVSCGDVNGDTFDDFAIVRANQEDVVLYLGNGDGTFQEGATYPAGRRVTGYPLLPTRVYLADVTNDDKLDLLTVISAWGGVSIRIGNGDGSFGPASTYVGAELASDIALGDVTRDGKLDLAMTDQTNARVSVFFLRDASIAKQQATDAPTIPGNIAPLLAQNYPNPFNPKTLIRYDLPVGGQVKLSVYDLRGRKVATLVNAKLPAGAQQVSWSGHDDRGGEVAAGVYLYRLVVDGAVAGQRKMVLVK